MRTPRYLKLAAEALAAADLSLVDLDRATNQYAQAGLNLSHVKRYGWRIFAVYPPDHPSTATYFLRWGSVVDLVRNVEIYVKLFGQG